MPCPGTTAETKAAPGSGWGHRRGTVPKASARKMWSPDERWWWWTTRETVCCQPPPAQVLPGPRAWGGSREPGSACWGSRSYTARRAAGETCATGGYRTTCTTCWRDREPGRSYTTRLCKFILMICCYGSAHLLIPCEPHCRYTTFQLSVTQIERDPATFVAHPSLMMADMWHARKRWVWWHAQLIFINASQEHVFTRNSVNTCPFSAVSQNICDITLLLCMLLWG